MKKLVMKYILLMFMTALVASAQDHAPLPEQCKADHDMWVADITVDTQLVSVASAQLIKRIGELRACEEVVPAHKAELTDLEGSCWALLFTRTSDFITRHRLRQEFLKEDAAGLR